MAHQILVFTRVKKELGKGKIGPGAQFVGRVQPVFGKSTRFGMRRRVGSHTYAHARLLLSGKGHQIRRVAKMGSAPVPLFIGGRVTTQGQHIVDPRCVQVVQKGGNGLGLCAHTGQMCHGGNTPAGQLCRYGKGILLPRTASTIGNRSK